MRPLAPQLCTGRVYHRRLHPAVHEFVYPVSYVLFDPDRPQDLTNGHRLWSTGRWAPIQVRSQDYGGTVSAAGELSLAAETRQHLSEVLPVASGASTPSPVGMSAPVRLLTQPRRWGWLFNPISVYFIWSDLACDSSNLSETNQAPVGVILEVTNTPWKERHRYPVALHPASSNGPESTVLEATFDKILHVSPFLDEDFTYRFSVEWQAGKEQTDLGRSGQLRIGIDAIDPQGQPVVETLLDLNVIEANKATLGQSLRQDGLPTHRTSFGIHRQALSLAAKRVPFVSHPRSRGTDQ